MIKVLWPIINSITLFRLALGDIIFQLKILVKGILFYVFKNKNKVSIFSAFLIIKKQQLQNKILRNNNSTNNKDKPLIFASACVNETNTGGQKYNGGVKMLNLLVKILRHKGYEAYLVTYDGIYDDWLIEHQPTISLKEFINKKNNNENHICITSFLGSTSFLKKCKDFYYWDMELALSDNIHFNKTFNYIRKTKTQIAGVNSMICAWHQAHWNRPCLLLPDWVDNDYWFPLEEVRKSNRIGYMNEGPETYHKIEEIKKILFSKGYDFEFNLISGNEKECLNSLRTCNIFLGMNPGKDPIWGESFGLPGMEAMAVGCAVISNDYQGNREYIHNSFNGLLVNGDNPIEYVEKIIYLMNHPDEVNKIKENSSAFLESYFGKDNVWYNVKNFLNL